TMGFFPVDDETLDYLRRTGRDPELIQLVERYCKEQGLFRTDDTPDPIFTDTLELDLSTVEPSMAGPKRPQDRILRRQLLSRFASRLGGSVDERGYALSEEAARGEVCIPAIGHEGTSFGHGVGVIASITSCSRTSEPSVMVAAGLLAKKAV